MRGGWDGHQPVEATDRFIPHLQAHGYQVRVEDSPRVYADRQRMEAVDLVLQCFTMGTIEADEVAGLRAAAAEHPITAGIDDFGLVTEQYWVLADDYVDVLATTTQAQRDWDPWHRPVTSPAVWTRQWGQGRVFVCTPGHRVEVLDQPDVRTVVERGLLWAGR